MCSSKVVADDVALGLYCSELIAHQLLFEAAFAIDDTSIIKIDCVVCLVPPRYCVLCRHHRGARLSSPSSRVRYRARLSSLGKEVANRC